jgi:hypothetical protein
MQLAQDVDWVGRPALLIHPVLSAERLCSLLSGSAFFVGEAASSLPPSAVLIGVSSVVRRDGELPCLDQLWWATVPHKLVGGVMNLQVAVGIPREWPKLALKPRTSECEAHLISLDKTYNLERRSIYSGSAF